MGRVIVHKDRLSCHSCQINSLDSKRSIRFWICFCVKDILGVWTIRKFKLSNIFENQIGQNTVCGHIFDSPCQKLGISYVNSKGHQVVVV